MKLNLPNWGKHGITLVGDLIDSNGIFISQKDLEKCTHLKTNFLEYLRVKMCVELYLKKYRQDSPLFFTNPVDQNKWHLYLAITKVPNTFE